jgi:pyruvate dehydrogenase E2 component (dihydrolipoamide acetyltransferase)
MSDTMEEGNIVAWLKNEGDAVEPGETIAEVETDKATMELDSYFEGVLLHIAVKEGTVPINGVIAVIGEKGEDWKAALEEADNEEAGSSSQEAESDTKGENKAEEKEEVKSSPSATSNGSSQNGSSSSDEGRIKASPLAKSIAKESGVDLAAISGSGDHGRIIKKDVEDFLTRQTEQEKVDAPATVTTKKDEAPSVVPFAFNADGSYEDVPVSQMRKAIARRLGESKFSAPHFYLTVEINMGNAIETRKKLNEVSPVKISFNDLVIKACASALRKHPAINSSWLGDKIRRNHSVNIGVAVAVDEGLLVPVIRHTDMKSLSQINTEVKTMAEKARAKRLAPEEMQGNTFTISNLGMFGIEEFTAIINPPDACILAVGGIIEKPIVKDGQIVPGNMMKVTLSCDHRVVDGATGAQFLQTLKQTLENPISILV